ncbi:MAG: hypothetical protein V3T00_10165 [bacterium]
MEKLVYELVKATAVMRDGTRVSCYERPAPAYHRLRWVRCTVCGRKEKVPVRGLKGKRLRDRVSPCCKARMRPLSWRPKTPQVWRKEAPEIRG